MRNRVLIVGGAAQAKRYRAIHHFHEVELCDARIAPPGEALTARAVDGLHELVRALMEAGEDPMERILAALDARIEWLVICDEVGCGVVPVDRFERDWREAVGRICCAIAERADVVERVSCGIPQRLKG